MFDTLAEVLKVSEDGSQYANINPELKNSRDIFLAALIFPILRAGPILQFAGEELRNNPEIVLIATKQDLDSFQFASMSIRDNKDIVLKAIENGASGMQGSCVLRYVSPRLQNDYDVVLASVKKCNSLQYASDELKQNENIVVAAISRDGLAFKHVDKSLRANKAYVLMAINNNGKALKYAAESFRNDKEVVLTAIKCKKHMLKSPLKYASYHLLGDRDVVLEAVRHNKKALKYVISRYVLNDGSKYCDDKEIILKAAPHYNTCFNQINDDLILQAIYKSGAALQYAPIQFKNNKDIVLAAISTFPPAYAYASYALKCDTDVLDKFISSTSGPINLSIIPDVVLNDDLFRKAPYFMRTSSGHVDVSKKTALLIASIRNNYSAVECISQYYDDEDVVSAALCNGNLKLEKVSERLRNNKSIVLNAVKHNGSYLRWASEELRSDREVVETAMQNYPPAIQYASNELRMNRSLLLQYSNNDYGFDVLKLPEWRDDTEIVTAITIATFSSAIFWASDRIRDDETVVRAILDAEKSKRPIINHNNVLIFVSERLRYKFRDEYEYGQFLKN